MMDPEKEIEKEAEKAEEEIKKGKDNLLFWSVAFIIALVVLFFAVTNFSADTDEDYSTVIYHNWEFVEIADLWWFEWQKGENVYQVPLRYNPYEVENVSVIGRINDTAFNSQKEIYITFDLSNESNQSLSHLALGSTELTQNIATAINRTPVAACVNNKSSVCEDRPIKTCENTEAPLIYLKEGGDPTIILNGNCIMIHGEKFELLRAVDRLLYHWYGVIK